MRDEVTELAFTAGWGLARRMPAPLARGTFTALADQAWLRHGRGVTQLERNLRRVVPAASTRELRDLSREAMRSYLRYWCEAFRLPDLTAQQIVDTHRCQGEHILSDALESGRGAVLVLPHMGNWDHAGAWATLTHAPLTTVAERLRPEAVYEAFLAYRRALGMEVLPLVSEAGPFRVLLQRAKAGRMICLLGDRDLTDRGVPVTFFGERATMPAGPAALALASGAPLIPATLWFGPGVSWTRIHPEVPVPADGSRAEKVAAMTQSCASIFESGIAEHPADWHMLQRVWLADGDRSPVGAR